MAINEELVGASEAFIPGAREELIRGEGGGPSLSLSGCTSNYQLSYFSYERVGANYGWIGD